MSILDRLLGRESSRDEFTGDAHSADAPRLVISHMQRRHIRSVMAIEQQVYPRPWTSRVFEEEIILMHQKHRYYLTAHVGNEVVGYGGLLFAGDDAHVTNLAVNPTWHRRGIATELLLELAWKARAGGFSALTLEVRHTNAAAQDLYRRFGFAPAGVRKKYYENTDDAIVMWCSDIQGDAFARRLGEIEGTRS
ncbi:MAG: ribosomal protein S18-alanine N-acetyltransferase [Ilumatobacteraceae bacterium]